MDANATETQNLLSYAATAKKAVTASFVGTFVLQFFLKGAMKMIWPLYGTLQIISVYLLFVQVKVPSNCITLAEQYNKIINMEIIPKEKIYQFLTKKNPELMAAVTGTGNSTMSEFATKSLGVGNPNMVMNLCLVLATLLFAVLAIIGVILFFKHKEKIFAKFPFVKYYAEEVKYMLMWSSILRSLTQGYLQMMINSVLNIQKMRARKTKDYSNDAVTCLTFMVLIAFPFFVYVLLYKLKHF